MASNETKTLYDFLKGHDLYFKLWKDKAGVYDIHIFNVSLMSFSIVDWKEYFEARFVIDTKELKFLHILKLGSSVQLVVGNLDTHDRIELQNAVVNWNKNEGLEIIWKETH